MNRRVVWIASCAVLVLVVVGLARLRFDTNVLGLLPDELPVVQGLKRHQEHFASAQELLLTVSAEDAATAEATARRLAEELVKDPTLVRRVLWRPPWLDDAASAGEFLAWSRLQQDPATTRALVEQLEPARLAESLRNAREEMAVSFSPGDLARLSYDPLGLAKLPGGGGLEFESADRLFVSADGTFRLLFVEPAGSITDYKAQIAWLEKVRKRVDEIVGQAGSPSHIGFTGGPVFAAETAGSMERDMTTSSAGTLLIIALLFRVAHRTWRPLLFLFVFLGVSVLLTFVLGAFMLGQLNIIGLGFVAILLGLVEDFGLVAYQERCVRPHASLAEIRRDVLPGILWSALTTAGAFLLLVFSGLPGLAQLGTLMALGVGVGVLVMLWGFLPAAGKPEELLPAAAASGPSVWPQRLGWSLTVALAVAAIGLLVGGAPGIDHSPDALRQRNSAAFAAMDEIQHRLERSTDTLFLVTRGNSAQEVADRLKQAEPVLAAANDRGEVTSFTLASAWWPNPAVQPTNLALVADVVRDWPQVRQTVLDAGFATNALFLADQIARAWSERLAATEPSRPPTGQVSEWVFRQASAQSGEHWYALGLIQPGTNALSAATLAGLEGSVITGWQLLGETVLDHVQGRLTGLLVATVAIIALCLWGAFRNLRDTALALLVLVASVLLLLAFMRVAGWSWNLLNLMALPLLLGTGVDYAIHVQLALRRARGDWGAAWRSTGKALALCGATTAVGFGSLAWAGNAGLASLGATCAVGVGCVLLVSLVALPLWWRVGRGGVVRSVVLATEAGPTPLYSARLWRLALSVVRRLPAPFCLSVVRAGLMAYRWLQPARVRVVAENLRPVVGDRAEVVARRVFDEFARKLCDLWRYEAGQSIEPLLKPLTGWEHLKAALDAKRGVLLVTVHLGNWEFGAPLLAARGIKLLVLTQPEPGAGFTELRREARARWGIETFVVGDDPFAFVEIIRRLQNGECVALLIDRPPAASAVEVELFGRPFQASVAAAELARATGCAVVPVVLPRVGNVYGAEVLPVVQYDRAALGNRAARTALTGEILRAFEPSLRQYPEQWFHFVPVWKPTSTTDGHR